MQVLGRPAKNPIAVPPANAPAMGSAVAPEPGKPAASEPEGPVALLCCLQDGARHVLAVDCPSLDDRQILLGHPALSELAACPPQYAPPLPDCWRRTLQSQILLLQHTSMVLLSMAALWETDGSDT